MTNAEIITGLLIVAGVVTTVLFVKGRRPPTTLQGARGFETKASSTTPNPEEVWRGLRDMVLGLKAEEMGLTPDSTEPYGFIMEMGYDNRDTKVTVVALRDGTMSLYLSSGGGMLGTGQSSPEAGEFAKQAVVAAKAFVAKLTISMTFPVPATGRVRFFILTGQGTYTAETDIKDVESLTDPLTPLFGLGQQVLTQIRLVSEAAQSRK